MLTGCVRCLFLAALETSEPVRAMTCPASRINEALWGALNQTVISGHEDGSLRLWDVETGKVSRRSCAGGRTGDNSPCLSLITIIAHLCLNLLAFSNLCVFSGSAEGA